MGFSFDIGAAVGGGLSALGGITQGYFNYESAKKNLSYQRDLQNQIFAREDSSMQRRVADLKAAGLSPVLAAGGSGAGAGSVISTQAPQMSGFENLGKSIETALAVKQLEQKNQDISKTAEENILIKKQQQKTDVDSRLAEAAARKADADTTKAIAETALTNLKADQQLLDNDIQRKSGLPSNPSSAGKMYRDFTGLMDMLFYPDMKKFFTPAINDQERKGKPYIEYYDPATGKVVKHN